MLYNTYFSRGANFRYIRELGCCAKLTSDKEAVGLSTVQIYYAKGNQPTIFAYSVVDHIIATSMRAISIYFIIHVTNQLGEFFRASHRHHIGLFTLSCYVQCLA